MLRLLNRRVGTIAPDLKTKIEALTIAQLEDLGEALLDFTSDGFRSLVSPGF